MIGYDTSENKYTSEKCDIKTVEATNLKCISLRHGISILACATLLASAICGYNAINSSKTYNHAASTSDLEALDAIPDIISFDTITGGNSKYLTLQQILDYFGAVQIKLTAAITSKYAKMTESLISEMSSNKSAIQDSYYTQYSQSYQDYMKVDKQAQIDYAQAVDDANLAYIKNMSDITAASSNQISSAAPGSDLSRDAILSQLEQAYKEWVRANATWAAVSGNLDSSSEVDPQTLQAARDTYNSQVATIKSDYDNAVLDIQKQYEDSLKWSTEKFTQNMKDTNDVASQAKRYMTTEYLNSFRKLVELYVKYQRKALAQYDTNYEYLMLAYEYYKNAIDTYFDQFAESNGQMSAPEFNRFLQRIGIVGGQ